MNANYVRIQADNLDRPLDINEGAKLDLGSTAKLRTLITYLEIITELHGRYAHLPRPQLALGGGGRDRQPDALGFHLPVGRGRPQPDSHAERRHGSPLFRQSGRTLLHRRRRPYLRQFRRQGQRLDPDRDRGAAQLDQPALHPHDARHRAVLCGGRRGGCRRHPADRSRQSRAGRPIWSSSPTRKAATS